MLSFIPPLVCTNSLIKVFTMETRKTMKILESKILDGCIHVFKCGQSCKAKEPLQSKLLQLVTTSPACSNLSVLAHSTSDIYSFLWLSISSSLESS